jgi:hypothetical protein
LITGKWFWGGGEVFFFSDEMWAKRTGQTLNCEYGDETLPLNESAAR